MFGGFWALSLSLDTLDFAEGHAKLGEFKRRYGSRAVKAGPA